MLDLIGKTVQFTRTSSASSYKVSKDLGEDISTNNVYLIESGYEKKVLKIYISEEFFISERRCAKLSHSGLVAPIEFGDYFLVSDNLEDAEEVEMYFTLMEYCSQGNLLDLILSDKNSLLTEEVIRTLFKQLVGSVTYLHKKGVAHGDIKLENIYINSEYQAKLGDLDKSFVRGDKRISQGSINYRPDEVTQSDDHDVFKADIYALGIVLFALHFSFFPFEEDELWIREMLYSDPLTYWELIAKMNGRDEADWSDEVKTLFEGMTRKNPLERFSIEEIKNSDWYKGETLNKMELSNWMKQDPSELQE